MEDKLVARIINKIKIPGLINGLVDRISFSDLQSLLLEVFHQKTKKLDQAALFRQYKSNRFVQPSQVDPIITRQFDLFAFAMLPAAYETIELSPVSPLGSCSLLAPVDQNNILSTIRNTEVSSDPTNLLALECARRRELLMRENTKDSTRIRLATIQRLVRTQTFDEAAAVPHFTVLSLCISGRDEGAFTFEREALTEQLSYFLAMLQKVSTLNLPAKSPRIVFFLWDKDFEEALLDLIANLQKQYPDIKIRINNDPPEQSYYSCLRYNIYASNFRDEEYFLCDGGFTDWTQQILNNQKERYLISGFGIERLFLVFQEPLI